MPDVDEETKFVIVVRKLNYFYSILNSFRLYDFRTDNTRNFTKVTDILTHKDRKDKDMTVTQCGGLFLSLFNNYIRHLKKYTIPLQTPPIEQEIYSIQATLNLK